MLVGSILSGILPAGEHAPYRKGRGYLRAEIRDPQNAGAASHSCVLRKFFHLRCHARGNAHGGDRLGLDRILGIGRLLDLQ